MEYDQEKLKELLTEAKTALETFFPLAKNEDEDQKPPQSEGEGEDEGEAPPASQERAPAEAQPEEGQEEGPMTPEQIQAAYMAMPMESLQVHMQAIQSAMDQKQSEQAPMDQMGEMLAKSLKALETLTKSQGESEKRMLEMGKQIEALLKTPQRAAVTEVLAKSEGSKPQLSRSEINAALRQVLRDGADLKKSDRDAIFQFGRGRVGVEAVQHLLNK